MTGTVQDPLAVQAILAHRARPGAPAPPSASGPGRCGVSDGGACGSSSCGAEHRLDVAPRQDTITSGRTTCESPRP